jgi:diacylglycerol kinase (ATP)
MQASIIYNANAGSAGKIPIDELASQLKQLGFKPIVHTTDSEADLDRILPQTKGLILTVGGDGTIRATALRLLNRKDVELAFIPAGTANNISKTFGIEAEWHELLDGLAHGQKVPYDVGRIQGPLGEQYFLEAFGCGIFADMLASYDPEEGKSVTRSIGTILDIVPGFQPYDWKLTLDGQDVSGRYVLCEALNTKMTGPHLNLAPDALPTDGLLDVVLVSDSQSEGFFDYVHKMRKGELGELQSVTVTKCSKLEIVWTGFPVHLDAEYKTDIQDPGEMDEAKRVSPELREDKDAVLAVDVLKGALTLRLPAYAASASARKESRR